MVRVGIWALIGVILVTPTAFAAPGTATVTASGPIDLEEAELRATGAALFGEGDDWSDATGTCVDLKLTMFRMSYLRAGTVLVPTDNESSSSTHSDASMRFTSVSEETWIGAYPGQDVEAKLFSPILVAEARNSEVIGNSVSTPEDVPTPDQASFGWQANGAALIATGASDVTLSGKIVFKTSELIVEVTEAGRTTTVDLRGSEAADGASGERRWAFLECHGGFLATAKPSTVVLAADRVAIDARRISTFALSATIDVEGAHASAEESNFFVGGDLSGLLTPLSHSGTAVARVQVAGDLSVVSILLPASPWRGIGTVAVLLVGLVMGAAATGVYLKARRRGPQTLTLEQCIDLAHDSADVGDPLAAVEWIDRALEIAPDSPRLMLDKGHFLSEAGHVDEAFEMYRKAAVRSGGESELLIARLIIQTGGDEAEAAQAVIGSLEANPIWLLEIEDDPLLSGIRARGDVREAMREARRALNDNS